MSVPLKTQQAKRHWAWANPHKVRDANRNYRLNNRRKTNAQAAARMRRHRAHLKRVRSSSSS